MANWVFLTPVVYDTARFTPDSTPVEVGLWRYFKNIGRGVNVFQLQDGTFVQDTPTIENANSAVPYPILTTGDKLDENGNLVHQYLAESWGIPGVNAAPNVTTTYQPNPVVRIFHGGHKHIVDDATAAQLTAAGYTVTPA